MKLWLCRPGHRICLRCGNIIIFLTGGAGFVGLALVRHMIKHTDRMVVNGDALTYVGTLSTVESAASSDRYRCVCGDVCETITVRIAIVEFARTSTPIWRSLKPISFVITSRPKGVSDVCPFWPVHGRNAVRSAPILFRRHVMQIADLGGRSS